MPFLWLILILRHRISPKAFSLESRTPHSFHSIPVPVPGSSPILSPIESRKRRGEKEFGYTHVQHKNAEPRLGPTSHVLPRSLDILFQLPDRILQRGSGVIHLVHDEDVFTHQIRHFKRRKIQPLRAGYLGAWRFDRLGSIARREGFVQGETDGLDRDIGRVGAFEKGSGGW